MQVDEEVEAFYNIIVSTPIGLQVILYRDPIANPIVWDSLPSGDEPYCPKDFIDATTYYIDPTEDADNLTRSLAGKGTRIITKRNEAFENRKL